MDSITLDLFGFDGYQAARIMRLLGGGLKEFKVHRLQDLAPSDLLEITGHKFSATVSLWTLIDQLLTSHEANCKENNDEYLELENTPRGFEEISIEDVGLSIRPVNVLRRENITTLFQLSGYSREELLNLGNLGVGSVNEIEKVLTSRGFKREIDAVPGIGTFVGTDIPLSSLPLSPRTSNSLLRVGVTKLSEVLGLSPDDLRDIRNIGQKSSSRGII
jgi:DNA-directed RNA polymerase alpha subunit